MKNGKLKISELRELVKSGEIGDPLIFLESVMNGQDPREKSKLVELVDEIENFSDGDISRADWNELAEKIRSDFANAPVTLTQSILAGKTLAEYLHAKRKNVEISGDIELGGGDSNKQLSNEEILKFREIWNSEF